MNRDDIYAKMRRKFNADWVDDVITFDSTLGYDYASAFIGVTETGRAVYDYDKMVQHIIDSGDLDDEKTEEDKVSAAADWISTNTLCVLYGVSSPIVIVDTVENGVADIIDERDDIDASQVIPGMEASLVGIGSNSEVVYYYDKIPDVIKNHEFSSNLILMHEIK